MTRRWAHVGVTAAIAAAAIGGCGEAERPAILATPSEVDAGAVPDATEGRDATEHGDADEARTDVDAPSHEDAARDADAPEDARGDAAFGGGPTCATAADGAPPALADTGLYSDFPTTTIAAAAGVHAYDPGLHLFSDGLDKRRFVYLPRGTAITTAGGDPMAGGTMDEWLFPVGARLWKEFLMRGTRIETRFLEKCADGSWMRATYRWSADGQTSATPLTTGALLPNTEPDANGALYEIPRQDQCAECHAGRVDNVLGFEAVALSWRGDAWSPPATIDGAPAMSRIAELGWLSQPPAVPIVVPGRDPGERHALGWLHANCGVACHNAGPNALARDTGLSMRLEIATLTSATTTNTWRTAVGVPSAFQPTFPDGGVASGWRRIALGSPETSTLPYRDGTRDNGGTIVGQQMPPIISHVVDGPDTAIVRAWIAGTSP
jgi:hypothetical protein